MLTDEIPNHLQEAFDTFKNQALETINNFTNDDVPQSTLYHYTNYTGLSGILESKVLHMKDYKALNDPSEIQFALNEVRKLIESKLSPSNPHINFWIDLTNKNIKSTKSENVFITSFCLREDYLTAWRLYADDAKGFAIGFKADFFKRNFSLPYKVHKVHYNPTYFNDCIQRLLEVTETFLKKIHENDPSGIYFITRIYLYVYCLLISAKLKHKAYQEEHEYRLCALKDDSDKNKDWQIKNPESPFVESARIIKKEFEVTDISEIWVGPRCNYEHAHSELIKILNTKDYDTSKILIKKSDIPYRNNFDFGPSNLLLEALMKNPLSKEKICDHRLVNSS